MQKLQCAVSNSVSHFIVILIYPNGFQVCAFMRSTSTEATVSRECARLSCRLTGRWASSLPARLSIENALSGPTNASHVKSPSWHLKQSPALVRVTRTIWMKRVGSDDWTARVGRGFCDCKRDFTGARYVNQERRSQLKPSTGGWCAFFAQQSKAPSQTPDSVIPI